MIFCVLGYCWHALPWTAFIQLQPEGGTEVSLRCSTTGKKVRERYFNAKRPDIRTSLLRPFILSVIMEMHGRKISSVMRTLYSQAMPQRIRFTCTRGNVTKFNKDEIPKRLAWRSPDPSHSRYHTSRRNLWRRKGNLGRGCGKKKSFQELVELLSDWMEAPCEAFLLGKNTIPSSSSETSSSTRIRFLRLVTAS